MRTAIADNLDTIGFTPRENMNFRTLASFAPIALVGCTTLAGSPAARSDNQPEYAGEYIMQGQGFGPNDRPYNGTCSLERQDYGYEVSCFNEGTRHTYVGEGLANGDTLAIVIGDVLAGDHNSIYAGEYLVVYQRQPNGDLTGRWLHATTQAAGRETLTRKQ